MKPSGWWRRDQQDLAGAAGVVCAAWTFALPPASAAGSAAPLAYLAQGQPDADAARPLPADLEIEFRRGACHGSCPVYRVTIHGAVLEYRGEEYVKVAGPIHERVDPTRIRLILASIDAFAAIKPGRRTPSGLDCRDSLYGDEGPSIRVLGGGRSFVYGRDGVCPT